MSLLKAMGIGGGGGAGSGGGGAGGVHGTGYGTGVGPFQTAGDLMQHHYRLIDQANAQSQHTRSYDPTSIWKETKKKLLCMRLEIKAGEFIPFEFIDFMQGEECVYVMVAKTKKDKPIIIEDDTGLFPSDTLVTQLRLMMG